MDAVHALFSATMAHSLPHRVRTAPGRRRIPPVRHCLGLVQDLSRPLGAFFPLSQQKRGSPAASPVCCNAATLYAPCAPQTPAGLGWNTTFVVQVGIVFESVLITSFAFATR